MAVLDYGSFYRGAGRKYKIPSRVLAGLTDVESGGDPSAVSPVGAKGATQFMPGTAPTYGVKFGTSRSAVKTQIYGAAKYLKALGYDSDPKKALASYNGGPGNPQYSYANDVLNAAKRYAGKLKGFDPGDGSGGTSSNGSKTLKVGVDSPAQLYTDPQDLMNNSLFSVMSNLNSASGKVDPNAQSNLELFKSLSTPQTQVLPGSKSSSLTINSGGVGGKTAGGVPLNVKSSDAPRSLRQMQIVAEKQSAAARPYSYGGGHGASPAKIGENIDCSGYVCQILGISPRTSGQLMKYGQAGHGKHITIYANGGHTFMSMKQGGKTVWYATSGQNPGGGAGRLKHQPYSTAYIKANYVARHPKGM